MLGLVLAATVAAEDLFKLSYLGQAAIAPDGAHAIVVQKRMNGPKNAYDSTILLVDVRSGKVVDATQGQHDGDFAWSPDSMSFYFGRPDKKKTGQIFRYTLASGAIAQLSHAKDGASSPVPSHDGKRIAFTVTDTDPAPATFVDFSKAGFKPSKAQTKSDIRAIDTLFYQVNGQGFVYDQHPHIWVMNADGSGAKQITTGRYGENGQSWSANDKTLVFSSVRYDPIDGANDIYAVSANGGALTKLHSDQPVNNPLFVSRKNNQLLYAASGVKDPAEYPALRWANFDGSNAREVLAKNTVSLSDSLLADMKEGGGPCGDVFPDERRMLTNADGPGYSNLRILDLQTGALRDLTPPRGEAWSCTLSADGKRVAYLYSDSQHPADLFVVDVATGKSRQLTHVNDAYLRNVHLSMPQPFTVKNSAGDTVYAWFLPALGKPGTKHPTILDIHGGPETQFGDTFFQEFQYYAALGYNVVYSNPRGSVGYGHAFESALDAHYGDAMFDDVESVMNQVITRPDVDVSRLGVSGGSYGGYATLWVISHTDRYKTAVAERVVSDLASENQDADFAGKGGLGGGMYGWGEPWDQKSMLYVAAMSPINYVNNVHTPLLILHSDLDTRTPIDQTVREFTLLKVLGQKVHFISVPGETHDLSRTGSPIHRVERLHILANWMNSYLKP